MLILQSSLKGAELLAMSVCIHQNVFIQGPRLLIYAYFISYKLMHSHRQFTISLNMAK